MSAFGMSCVSGRVQGPFGGRQWNIFVLTAAAESKRDRLASMARPPSAACAVGPKKTSCAGFKPQIWPVDNPVDKPRPALFACSRFGNERS